MSDCYVYDLFEGSVEMKLLFGGKGVGVVEMKCFGVLVFDGFIVIIEVCVDIMMRKGEWFEDLEF